MTLYWKCLQWLSNARPVPVERCSAIERATNGAVTRRDLRPKDWADSIEHIRKRPANNFPAFTGNKFRFSLAGPLLRLSFGGKCSILPDTIARYFGPPAAAAFSERGHFA